MAGSERDPDLPRRQGGRRLCRSGAPATQRTRQRKKEIVLFSAPREEGRQRKEIVLFLVPQTRGKTEKGDCVVSGSPDKGEDVLEPRQDKGEDRERMETVLFWGLQTKEKTKKEGRLYCSRLPDKGERQRREIVLFLGPSQTKEKTENEGKVYYS